MLALLIATDEFPVLALYENAIFARRAGLDRRLADRKVTRGVVFAAEEAPSALACVSFEQFSAALGTGH